MSVMKIETGKIVDKSLLPAKKLYNKLQNSEKKVASLQKQVASLRKKVLAEKMKTATLQRKLDDNENGVIQEYERDLIWMAYRYAIGRHTIHAFAMCSDMVRNVPGRVSESRAQFMAEDIQREIGMNLRFLGCTFEVDVSIPPSSVEFRPLDAFIGFILTNGIRHPEDLKKYKHILYLGRAGENAAYNAYQIEEHEEPDGNPVFIFSFMEWEDLMCWNDLSKLLDKRCHRYAIIKDKRYKNKFEMVEYFTTYVRDAGYNVPEDDGKPLYKQILVPVVMFQRNPELCYSIDEETIIVDGIEETDKECFMKKYHIQSVYNGM